MLAGDGDVLSGSIEGVPERVALVSYERQAELIAAERRKDDADILDVISEGTPVAEIIEDGCQDLDLARSLVDTLGLRPLMSRAFRKLSTGETRKVMLIRALTSRPDLLVLDEPFDGLDLTRLNWSSVRRLLRAEQRKRRVTPRMTACYVGNHADGTRRRALVQRSPGWTIT